MSFLLAFPPTYMDFGAQFMFAVLNQLPFIIDFLPLPPNLARQVEGSGGLWVSFFLRNFKVCQMLKFWQAGVTLSV